MIRIASAAARRRDALSFIDDVGRDQDQQVALLFTSRGLTEELSNERQIHENRDADLRDRHFRHGEPADHGRLAIRDEELVVGTLLLEREAEVRRRRLEVGALRVQRHQDVAVVCDVRRDGENDARLLEVHGRARRVLAGATALALRAQVDHADRGLLTDEDLRLPVVERHDARLRLNVGKPDFLKRVDERREVELADRGREDQLERGIDDTRVRVRDRGQCVAADVDDVGVLLERLSAEGVVNAVAVGIYRLEGARVGALDELVEELRLAAQVIRDAELLDIGAVDEDDLRLDRDLRRANVQVLDVPRDLAKARRDVGNDQLLVPESATTEPRMMQPSPPPIVGRPAAPALAERAAMQSLESSDRTVSTSEPARA